MLILATWSFFSARGSVIVSCDSLAVLAFGRCGRDLPDDSLRQAIETCERFVDGLATFDELETARELANDSYEGIGDIIADHSAIAVAALCEPEPWFPMGEGSSGGIAAVEAEARFSHVNLMPGLAWDRKAHCRLLRDIVGNPFLRLPHLSPAVLTWNDATVHRIGERIYAERAFDRMPILHDALLDAGCDDEALLLSTSPQLLEAVLGCWALDLILHKK